MSERINVHVPILSVNSRSVIGNASQDHRRVTSQRTGHGGHIHDHDQHGDDRVAEDPPSSAAPGSHGSRGSLGSLGSLGSFGSVRSVGSVGSILSIGSAGSILSIGSAGSILSIGAAGSVLSIGSAGSVLSIGSVRSIGTIGGRETVADRLVAPAATLLTLAALAGALGTLRR